MSLKEVTIETAAAAMLAGAFYFAGWAYLSHYFSAFGIDITEVDIPLNTILVFAFRPLKNPWLLLALAVWLGLAVLYVWGRSRWSLPAPSAWPTVLVLPTTVALAAAFFLLIDWSARSRAHEYARDVWKGHRVRPSIPLNANSSGHVEAYRQCQSGRRMVQVFAAPERTYLLCLSEYFPDKGALYVLDKDRSLISVRRIDRSAT